MSDPRRWTSSQLFRTPNDTLQGKCFLLLRLHTCVCHTDTRYDGYLHTVQDSKKQKAALVREEGTYIHRFVRLSLDQVLLESVCSVDRGEGVGRPDQPRITCCKNCQLASQSAYLPGFIYSFVDSMDRGTRLPQLAKAWGCFSSTAGVYHSCTRVSQCMYVCPLLNEAGAACGSVEPHW